MTTLREVEAWIADRLPALIEKYDVPGAAFAVLADGEVVDGAAGGLSTTTGVGATADSVFQIGSITTVWTATLVMQLVDEGRLDLDAPVRTHLPEFRIADESAAATITTRQLLKHTAGFEGDIFTDTGVGDDCVEKYLEVLHEVPQLFPPDELFSYNNAGFCVLGRLVEVLRGKPFDVCLREHLATPLGLTHTATSPYEAILHRAAVGHLQPEPDAAYEPAPVWGPGPVEHPGRVDAGHAPRGAADRPARPARRVRRAPPDPPGADAAGMAGRGSARGRGLQRRDPLLQLDDLRGQLGVRGVARRGVGHAVDEAPQRVQLSSHLVGLHVEGVQVRLAAHPARLPASHLHPRTDDVPRAALVGVRRRRGR